MCVRACVMVSIVGRAPADGLPWHVEKIWRSIGANEQQTVLFCSALPSPNAKLSLGETTFKST